MMEWSNDGVLRRMPGNPRTRDAAAYEAKLLDAVNLRLLEELADDGRLGIAELGRRVGLSAPAVAERVQRLERAGVIIVRIRPFPGQLQRIPELARESVEVAECYRVTGEDCYLMRLHLRSLDDLEELLDRFTPHGQTTTSIIHSAPVPRRGPPLR